MTTSSTTKAWDSKRTDETRAIEDLLRKNFQQADSYRYNSASIRVRVIDARFERMSREQRDSLLEEQLEKLPPDTQRDIVTLFAFAPSELAGAPNAFKVSLLNLEFDDPSPSMF